MKTILAAPSPVLYHITGVGKLANILETDRFELKPSDGTRHERSLQKHAYYLSTSRNPSNDYFHRNATKSSVIIVLDGGKLAHRYKAAPTDYWGPEMRKDNDEMEDRISSPEPFIPNAKSYIKEIHVLWEKEPENEHSLPYLTQAYYDVYRAAKFAKIPIYMYGFTDKEHEQNKPPGLWGDPAAWKQWVSQAPSKLATKAFLLLDKRRADKDVDIKELFRAIVPPRPMDDYTRKYGNPPKSGNGIAPWIFLYRIPMPAGMEPKDFGDYIKAKGGKEAYDSYYTLAYYPRDAWRRIETNIHNDRSQPYGKANKVRENIDALVKIMRREHVDAKGFVELLRRKFLMSERYF